MGITSKYNQKELFKEFDSSFEEVKNFLIDKLFETGKRAVDIAFSDGNYINRTGVLRSSIGCGISYGGVILKTYGFFSVAQEGSRGVSLGKDLLLDKLKSNVRSTEVKLAIVAGADYASFVEDSSSYTVLESGVNFMENNLLSILKQLKVLQDE